MGKLKKIIFLIFIFLFVFCLLVVLPGLDWQKDWFFVLALGLCVLITAVGLYDFKKLILLLILILPALLKFNDLKIDLAKFSPLFKNYNLPLNLTALACSFIILFGLGTILVNWQKIKSLPLKSILFLYVCYLIISIAWSKDLALSLSGLVYFIAPPAIYIITYSYFSSHLDFIKTIFFVLASAIIPLALSAWQIVDGQYFFEPDSALARIKGPFVHPNLFGLYLFVIIGLAVSYYLAKRDKSLKRNLIILFFTVALAIVFILTYSRVSWACLALFLFVFAFLKRYLIILLSIITPMALLTITIFESIRFRVMEIFENAFFNSWVARKNIWQVSWQEILEKPFFGNGVGTSEMVIEEAKNWTGGTSLPHNDFLLYGLELGLVGFFLFITYTLGAIYYASKTFFSLPNLDTEIKIFGQKIILNFKTLSLGILILISSLFLASFFESVSRGLVTQIMVWAVLGSLFGLKNLERESLT